MTRRLGMCVALAGTFAAGLHPAQAAAAEATFGVRHLTPETALKAAQAALKHCRDGGYQVAVAVVDRGGVAQVMLRDRFAGAHTPKTATGKAWTAVSFRTGTLDLARETQPGKPASGIRDLRGVVMVGGGLMIEGGGALVGGIGVSGAPGGEIDEACAKAGIDAIRDALEF
ncbi:MAG TPA: hypothetical protein DHV08_04930 [Rhodocyclaceae bacterium]|nr:MAG: hypothetical protein AUK49_11525 [Betaproteobacteria bacterium CG2_30_68_42]PIV75868.1 MAG: hypothetical protein COW56_02500 [Rhodocyclales bacterium CG17_big_fil_post_rev_8_21_14_2_50_68_7]PIX74003.1 MAG: hypothetical protein COZ38_11845 [Rhodocyclales bacterium CG_4_10_14_3_um_filter_68_10]PJA57928.1 MAG: hypothetical protein CO164_05380 [Rhodocyclales bacterium CG_4_9_14_3_um_filter_68_10]HCX32956.1 hypothetical protein [Rhodocyclaceae bacterium]